MCALGLLSVVHARRLSSIDSTLSASLLRSTHTYVCMYVCMYVCFLPLCVIFDVHVSCSAHVNLFSAVSAALAMLELVTQMIVQYLFSSRPLLYFSW